MNFILITGAAGFIGSNLVDSLSKLGYKIIGVDNFDPFYDKEIKLANLKNALRYTSYRFYAGDIKDSKLLNKIFSENKIDVIIHLAAKAGVRPSIENPREYYSVNVDGTLNILEAMRKYKVKKMLFASSSSVYGNNDKVPFTETDSVDNPISPYAASKKAGELLCHTYHHLNNFDIFCLRFFTVYGPRQRPDLAINKFTDRILKEKSIEIYGDGSTSRDYTYIDDIIDGIIKTIKVLNGFEIINLGESQTIKLLEMITILEKNLNKQAIKKYLPMQPGDVELTYADISKAKKLLGYSPSTDFEAGIKKFIKWKLRS